MNRRRLLAALAAAPVAGCLGRSDPDDGTTPTTTDTTARTTSTTTTTPAPDASVHGVTVTPELVAMNSPDSTATAGDRDEQFVVAAVSAAESPRPDRTEFALDVDGETRAPTTDVGFGTRLWERGMPYGEERDGWLAFRLPKPLDADDVTLSWPAGEHALSADALARLNRPPTTFEVREFAVPDSAAPGDTVTATLTVANVGDADGTFVGALDRVGPMVAHAPAAAISLDAAAGATATWEYTHALDHVQNADDRRMKLLLDWRDGSLERTTDVKSE